MQHFDGTCSSISIDVKKFNFRYLSPHHYLHYFRTHYGLCRKAFEVVGPENEQALSNDILAIVDDFNVAQDGTMCAPSEYLQIVMTKD